MDRACIGLQIAGQNVEEGGFTGAIVAPEQHHFALPKVRIHAIQHHLATERLS